MAYAQIRMKNPVTGAVRKPQVGFSWTAFFFNLFNPLFRKHWSLFFILAFAYGMIFLTITVEARPAEQIPLLNLYGLTTSVLLGFFYNKIYIKHLIKKGFIVEEASVDIGQINKKLKFDLPTAKDKPVV